MLRTVTLALLLPATAWGLEYPILFVTQVPQPSDFTTIGSVFGNHDPSMQSVPRGGDLWIVYPDGSTKNLTATAGYGETGLQGADAIAVRDPAVHWSGQKALFSMVIGAPTEQYVYEDYLWQIYEVSGLGKTDTPVITKVPNQPAFNNISPTYGTDERVLFTSDRPRNGAAHLYPQLDEYEEAPTNTGIWSLSPATGDLFMVNHVPSGAFEPFVDSFGRVVFMRWDHLQRDQQADADEEGAGYGTFDWSSEAEDAVALDQRVEVFPEPRDDRQDLLAGTNLQGHSINHFFPWTIDQDGREEETLNHIGRHELHSYFDRSLNDDDNLEEFISVNSGRLNDRSILNFIQIVEDPETPGLYYGVDAPEFYTHAAGQIVTLYAPPDLHADAIPLEYVTHRDTQTNEATADHSGHYRDPLPTADGTLIAAHTFETGDEYNLGTRAAPEPAYRFRLRALLQSGSYFEADTTLTGGIVKAVSFWDPDVLVSYDGELWELQPVEVRPRAKPVPPPRPLPGPEASVFTDLDIDPADFRAYLLERDLAVIVSRNVTRRDVLDVQQPYNLKVAGAATQTVGSSGKLYEVATMQLFQADLLRGTGGVDDPSPGRRVLARALHDDLGLNQFVDAAPPASVALGADGSMAAFVPARRATSWQLLAPDGTPVVRERYWLSFAPGEIRVCATCHGLSSIDQVGGGVPENPPEALRDLLVRWQEGGGSENPGNEEPGNEDPGNEDPGNEDPGDDEPRPERDPQAAAGCACREAQGEWFVAIVALFALRLRRRFAVTTRP